MDIKKQTPVYRFNLKEKRKEKGLLQAELAKLTDIGIASVRRYENGKRLPDVLTAHRLAQALGCKIEDFIVEVTTEEE